MFDLILRGGTVVDPGRGIEGLLDVAVEGGRIAAVAGETAGSESARVVDVRGKLVMPGLVDLHTHLYWGATGLGLEVDRYCLERGVTTAVDAGSSGPGNFAGFRRWIAEPARTRVYCFLHLSSIGLAGVPRAGELADPAYADPQGVLEILGRHPELVVGLKLRVEEVQVGGSCLPMLKLCREVADAARVPIMVHIGNSLESLPEILQGLRAGDIVTHCLTGRRHGLLDAGGRVLPQVREARERGVLFDSAHGRGHCSHSVAARLLDQGFLPDTISTDLTRRTVNGPVYDLPTMMTKFLLWGLSLPEVVRRTTYGPAQVLRRESSFGTLEPGSIADITVLEWRPGEFRLEDTTGDVMVADRRLVPSLVLRAGEIVGGGTGP